MILISESLKSALCEQVGHERYNANLYLYMCGFLKNKGLDGLSKHFIKQHDEETEHSLDFFNLLTDLNADVYIPEIDEVNTPYNTITELAQAYLNREILTTKSIHELIKLAIGDNNPVVEQKCREMISKQQKEYEEATTFLDNALLCGDDWWKCKVWSDSIGG